jgi:LacI family transcriptional regulator
VVDRLINDWDVDSVSGDSVEGARLLVRHLLFTGHRRIAVISGPANSSTADDRVRGFQLALEEVGVSVDPGLVKRGEYRKSSGEQLTYELLDREPRPTAIFAANNVIALGVLAAVTRRGLRIPQDVALVCYDDLPEASQIFPFLTVMAQPAYEMGTAAAQLLFDRLVERSTGPSRHLVLPAQLIVRYSCGSRPGPGGTLVSLPLGGG